MKINSILHTNQSSIDRVLNAGLPVVLAFWTQRTPLAPTLETLLADAAQKYAGQLLIAKVDAATEAPLLARFDVSQTPALLFTKAGRTEGKLAGSPPAETVQKWLHYLVQGGERPKATAPTQTGATNGAGHPVTLTDSNFQQTIQSALPVLVDFWAPWCGPCRMVAPAVEQLAREFQGRAVVGKLNVDENPRTAQQYGIMSIPALYIFQRGQIVEQMVGAQPAHVLQQRLARHVG